MEKTLRLVEIQYLDYCHNKTKWYKLLSRYSLSWIGIFDVRSKLGQIFQRKLRLLCRWQYVRNWYKLFCWDKFYCSFRWLFLTIGNWNQTYRLTLRVLIKISANTPIEGGGNRRKWMRQTSAIQVSWRERKLTRCWVARDTFSLFSELMETKKFTPFTWSCESWPAAICFC